MTALGSVGLSTLYISFVGGSVGCAWINIILFQSHIIHVLEYIHRGFRIVWTRLGMPLELFSSQVSSLGK